MADLSMHVGLRCQDVLSAEHRDHIGVVVGGEHRMLRIVVIRAELDGSNLRVIRK